MCLRITKVKGFILLVMKTLIATSVNAHYYHLICTYGDPETYISNMEDKRTPSSDGKESAVTN